MLMAHNDREVLMSGVDNLVINNGSTTTDEANWGNQTSREPTLLRLLPSTCSEINYYDNSLTICVDV